MRRSGFSILELLVVLALMAILAAITVPSLRRWQATLPLEQSASAIQQLVARVQLDALRSGRSAGLTLESSGALFTPAVSVTTGREVLPLRLPDGIRCLPATPEGSRSTSRTRSDGGLELIFHPDGTATPACLVLEDPAGRNLGLVIHRLNGSVSVAADLRFAETAMTPAEFRSRCAATPDPPKTFPMN
jgi:type II secretion system protein H